MGQGNGLRSAGSARGEHQDGSIGIVDFSKIFFVRGRGNQVFVIEHPIFRPVDGDTSRKAGQFRKDLPDYFNISFSDKKDLDFRPVDHVSQLIGSGPEV